MYARYGCSRPPRTHGTPAAPFRLYAVLTIAMLALASPGALAQQPSQETYSLRRTIDEALASSAEVATATRIVAIDRKQADVEFARLRPSVRIDASGTRYDDKTTIAIAGSQPITLIKDHSEAISAGLSLDLDLFGQIRAAASQAKLQSLSDRFTLAQIRNQRITSAKSIYYELLRAEHQVLVAQAALATAVQQQATAVKLNLGQVGQKIDVLRANTQVANSRQELTAAQNDRDLARNNFNDLVGRPLNSPVQVEDVPGVTSGVDVGADGAIKTPAPPVNPPYSVSASELAAIDVAGSVASANQVRPEVLAAQVQVRVAETGIKLARRGLEPELSVSASTSYYPTTSFQQPRQSASALMLGISIPLYDGGATRARVQAARLETDNAHTALDRRRKDVALQVRQTYLNLVTSARQIDAANIALQQAIAARQLAQARYEGQVGLYLEVTDAQAALVQAETSQVNSVYSYLIARAQFENAIGAPSLK